MKQLFNQNMVRDIRFPPPVADAMVRAILDGRKTVTRRVVKQEGLKITGRPAWGRNQVVYGRFWFTVSDNNTATAILINPPYHPGDNLYVRETFAALRGSDGSKQYVYKATDTYPFGATYIAKFRWRPSIHMPKEAARLFLRVTDVRVERLWDISDRQAQCEGVSLPLSAQNDPAYAEYIGGYYNVFMELWDSTIKKVDLPLYGWDANPYVWVIEFERISKEEVRHE